MVFAVLLTLIVMLMALTMTDSSPVAVVNAWGEGLTGLLAFITQMCLALLFGHALAHTRQVQGVLSKVSSIPKNAVQAYAWVTLLTCLVSWAQWSLGLIVGAILAKGIATSCRERGIKVHFPLLVAAAYTGFIPYHMGYSGAAPLTSAHSWQLHRGIPGCSGPGYGNGLQLVEYDWPAHHDSRAGHRHGDVPA